MSKRHANLDETRTDQAIEALLNSRSLLDASNKAGIPYTSLRRLLGQDKFQDALREARTQVLDAALTRLRGLAEEAVQVIEDTSKGKNTDHLRFTASKWIIEHGTEGMVADLNDRIRKLEGDRK